MSSLRIRLAAGAAALIAAASVGASIPSPALAAGPELEISYGSVGNVDNSGLLMLVYAYNWGDEPASDVTMTFDASGLRDVDISVPDWVDNCRLDGTTVTCELPSLAAEHTELMYPFWLKSRQQSKPGPAGTLKGTIRGFGPGDAEYSGGGDLEVTIVESGPDLVAFAEDINSAKDPVGGGDVRPVMAAIYNDGDTPTGDWFVQIQVPTGGGIVEQYSDCEYWDNWPGEHPAGYVYGPTVVTCRAPAELDPLGVGEGLIFADENGESLFHVAFGKNLRGPEETHGNVQVGLVDDLKAARTKLTREGSSGKTFAGAVAKLQPTSRAASRSEGNTENNWASFSIWTKPNKHDFTVTAEPVRASIGDTVEIPYTVVNNGPSDGAASWRFKAPTGTLLVSDSNTATPWCSFNDSNGRRVKELPEVTCSTESEFPAKASGYQGVKAKMKLRIISTPGDDGTLRVRSSPASAESNTANDEVKLVVTVGGSGGSGGGLPITGPNAALIGAISGGVMAIGVALFLFARRRRTVIVSE